MTNRVGAIGVVIQLLSVVVALAVIAHGVAVLVWAVEYAGVIALVLFGVAALVAAPTGLYRKEGVPAAAVGCAFLLVCVAGIAIFLACLTEAMKYIGPGPLPWRLATPVIATALSAAAILVCKTCSSLRLG